MYAINKNGQNITALASRCLPTRCYRYDFHAKQILFCYEAENACCNIDIF